MERAHLRVLICGLCAYAMMMMYGLIDYDRACVCACARVRVHVHASEAEACARRR